jgi:ABC-2 type transport system permease protein
MLLLRSPLAVGNAVLCPLLLGVGFLLLTQDSGKGTGGDAGAMQLLMLLGFAPYVGATTTLAARRQELVLKRLRTCALSGGGILAGLLAPFAVLVVVQAAVLCAVTATLGDEPPVRWWPFAAAVAAGTVLAAALAFVTAAVTPVPELAQLTTVPVFFALFGGGIWLMDAGEATWPMRLVPGVPIAELARSAWSAAAPVEAVAPLLAIAVLSALSVALAARTFRWEPRR